MKIHQATAKKAAERGITLNVIEHPEVGEVVNATWKSGKKSLDFYSSNPKDLVAAMDAMIALSLEYPALSFTQDPETKSALVKLGDYDLGATHCDGSLKQSVFNYLEDAREDEALAALVDAEEEDEPQGGSVVPSKYREAYRAAGHPDHCGDWLAFLLEPLVTGRAEDGKKAVLNVAAMQAICDANGLDVSKYLTNRSNGWQGRFRMTARNMLAKVVATKGVLVIPASIDTDGKETTLEVPEDFRAKYAKKEKPKKAKKAAETEAQPVEEVAA